MAEVAALLHDLEDRVRRLLRIAKRTGMDPEEIAEDVIRLFSTPEQTEQHRQRLADQVGQVALASGTTPYVVFAAVFLPPGRLADFEAVEGAKAFRLRLEQRHGGPLPDSTSLIREDRQR